MNKLYIMYVFILSFTVCADLHPMLQPGLIAPKPIEEITIGKLPGSKVTPLPTPWPESEYGPFKLTQAERDYAATNKSSVLHFWIKNAEIEKARSALSGNGLYPAKRDLNRQDKNGNTPLHIAAQHRISEGLVPPSPAFDLIKVLIEAGANPNIKNNNGKTVLNLLVEPALQVIESRKNMLKTGMVTMDIKKSPWRPLVNIFEYLVQQGADIYTGNPQFFDSFKNNLMGYESPNFTLQPSPAGLSWPDYLKQLYEKAKGSTNNAPVIHNTTPLIKAVESANVEKVKKLIKSLPFVELNRPDESGNNALHHIAKIYNSNKSSAFEIIKLLEKAGISINLINKENQTLLTLLCKEAQKEAAKRATMRFVQEPYSVWNNYVDVFEYLVKAGANINLGTPSFIDIIKNEMYTYYPANRERKTSSEWENHFEELNKKNIRPIMFPKPITKPALEFKPLSKINTLNEEDGL